MTAWREVATDPPPVDGRELLMKVEFLDGSPALIRVCSPKLFRAGVWEYHRDEKNAPGHTWSLQPTHWMEIPA